MSNGGLSNGFVKSAAQSFKMTCLSLLDLAYVDILATHTVSYEWEENAISEFVANQINKNPICFQLHITVETVKRLVPDSINQALPSVDSEPQIDFMIGGFGLESRVRFYMEAKNLYSQDFKKHKNKRYTSSSYYAKRYISTGINHILSGYYPCETLLLGYVLIGTIKDAVNKVNLQLTHEHRGTEQIDMRVCSLFSHLTFGLSSHPHGALVEHCFLLFS